jgi:hypothetical protein
MAFKMKYSSGTPFHFHGGDPAEHTSSTGEIDPKKLDYKTTKTVQNLAGEYVDTAGTATVTLDPTRKPEKLADSPEAYLQSFQPEYTRAKQDGYPGTLPEYIKEKEAKLGYTPREVTVTRERDYNQDVKLYPNPFKGMEKYKDMVLERNIRDSDSLPQATITRAFKTVNDREGFQAYLDKYGYKRRKRKPRNQKSESLSNYKYTVNE